MDEFFAVMVFGDYAEQGVKLDKWQDENEENPNISKLVWGKTLVATNLLILRNLGDLSSKRVIEALTNDLSFIKDEVPEDDQGGLPDIYEALIAQLESEDE